MVRQPHYGPRGVNGPIDDLLFPINHGILYYPGYTVLPPFVTYSADRLDEARFAATAESLRQRMRTLETTPPIAYRQQNGGDYLIPSMELREGLGQGSRGLGCTCVSRGTAVRRFSAGARPGRR